MHLEGAFERERQVPALCMLQAVFQEIGQRFAEIGVGAVLDNEPRAVFRGEPAEVGKALLRHENLRIVLRVVHVTHVGHDATDSAALRDRGRKEEAEGAVAGKVRRAADAVHHCRTANETAVHVPEDIGLEGSVHRDDAHAADDVGTIAHFLLAEHEMLFPIGGVLHELLLRRLRQRERRAGGDTELALLEERKHRLLDDFGKQVYLAETIVVGHGTEHRVRNLAYATLEGHALREPAVGFLEADKVQDALADIPRDIVGFYKRGHLVVAVVFHDGNYFICINADRIFADAVTGRIDGQGFRMRRQFGQGAIVHADAAVAQARIQFQNNFLRHLQVRDRVAARCRKADTAVGHNRADFDNGDSRRRHGAGTHEIAHLAEVGVEVVDAAVVDSLAQARIALVRHTELHRLRARKGAIAAIACRGAREKGHLELFARLMEALRPLRNRERNSLRVTRQRKAGNSENITVLNHFGRGRGTALSAFNPIHALKNSHSSPAHTFRFYLFIYFPLRDPLYQVQYHRRTEHAHHPRYGVGPAPDVGLEPGTVELPGLCRRRHQQLPHEPHLELQEQEQEAHRSHPVPRRVPLQLRPELAGAGALRLPARERILGIPVHHVDFQVHEADILREHRRERGLRHRQFLAVQKMGIQALAPTAHSP